MSHFWGYAVPILISLVGWFGLFMLTGADAIKLRILGVVLLLASITSYLLISFFSVPDYNKPEVLVCISIFCTIWFCSHQYSVSCEYGAFVIFHPWARKLIDRAESLVRPNANFNECPIKLEISHYLEWRWNSRNSYERKQLKEFYGEWEILFMLLIISYEKRLFGNFKGTNKAVYNLRPYREIFDAAAQKLKERGADLDEVINQIQDNYNDVDIFCSTFSNPNF